MKSFFLFALIAVSLVTTGYLLADEELMVVHPRVEYKTNPLGVESRQPRFSWQIVSPERNTLQTAWEIRCADTEEALTKPDRLLWQIKKQSAASVHVPYAGPALISRQRVFWQVRVWDNHDKVSDWSAPAWWEMGLLDESNWQADWISAGVEEDSMKSRPAQYYRREFQLEEEIIFARLYITSHGLYEAYINGQRVGDQVFTPGWTSYKKNLQYQVYDVTDLLKDGRNAIGVILGDGWYRGNLGWKYNRNFYGKKLALLAQLELILSDGSRQVIGTDSKWRVTNDSPIRMSDIYMGEEYDARMEMTGWSSAGFDDKDWSTVQDEKIPMDMLHVAYGPPVRKVEEIHPVKIIPAADGKYIFDLGQNMVGWVRLKIQGQRGERITLRHAEVLDKEGRFYTANLRSADQTIQYTLKGGGEEVYEPHFTFQGFRYVELSAYKHQPDPDLITGMVIHSDMQATGSFQCSDPLINQLQHNILWGLWGNFLDIPTDCPQRDERMGWMGDAQVFAPTACFNVDAAAFYSKWLIDVALDQQPDGKTPDVVPDVLKGGGGHTGWADAAVVIPWIVYLNYGDKRVLERQYSSMKAWISYMQNRAGADYVWDGDWHYGDWLSFNSTSSAYPGAYTETDLIATAYFAHSANLVARTAMVLGKKDEAAFYNNLSKKIKQAFNREFVTPQGRLVSHTQTAYTLALAFDLLPKSARPRAAAYLAGQVRRFKHITTGFLGTPLINQVLAEHGYLDLAYLLLNRREYPSWLYPVTMGATTIWERWDGIKPDSTFQNPGMNSFNHYAYGAIGKWLYSTVAGLQIDESQPGYKHFIIQPHPGGGLTSASAGIETMYGHAGSAWRLEQGVVHLNAEIPSNTTATVILPNRPLSRIRMDDKPVESFVSRKPAQMPDGSWRIELGSGQYRIRY